MNIISKKAKIGKNLTAEPFCIIDEDVEIGDNVFIGQGARIGNGSRIGNDVKILQGAIIASHPHSIGFKDEYSTVEIGDGTWIKEYSTISRATNYSNRTIVGKNCYIMSYVHVAHDNIIGDNVVLTNSVNLGGHVIIGSDTNVGGMVSVHQFCKIGDYVMLGANTKVTKDIPPYSLIGKSPHRFMGINFIGLKRKGFSSEAISNIRDAYRIIYDSGLNFTDALKKLRDEMEQTKEIINIINFFENSTRGILPKA